MTSYCRTRRLFVGLRLLGVCQRLSLNGSQSIHVFASKCQYNSNTIEKQRKKKLEPKITANIIRNVNKRPKEEAITFDPRFADTFGNLGVNDMRYKRLASEDLPEDEDNYDKLEIKRGPKMAPIGYSKQLDQYINKKPIQMKKALQLYNKMISEDRVPPDKCTYTLLMTGCAKVGFTEKAFELFDEMLKYELKPTRPAITALFNACAECPFPEFGLQKASYLRDWMSTNGFVANTLHYHSMIKAFGKLGDMKTAYELVDEMVSKGQTTTDETFAMLLIGCVSNKESGLYEAIKLFNRMRSHNIPLTIYTFNLLLRAVRDCGIGSEENLKLLVENSNRRPQDKSFHIKSNKKVPKTSNIRETESPLREEIPKNKSLVLRTPNLLMENILNEKNLIEINYNSLSIRWNRFMLLGGIEGFVQMMNVFNVKPNINTLTLMTELIDFKEESEDVILGLLEKFNVKLDTDFFNILIKHICLRRGMVDAKRIIGIMSQNSLQPDIFTFGVISLGCNSIALGKQLLSDMNDINIRPNIQIMGGLLRNACKTNNFHYINLLINYMKDNHIKADHKFIENLEAIKIKFTKLLAEYDWNNREIDHRFQSQRFRNEFSLFKENYQKLIQNTTIDETPHPWHQFQIKEIPNKKQMHSFVKFMKQKIEKRRGMAPQVDIDEEYEEDELYDD